jgi:hypothetical protein
MCIHYRAACTFLLLLFAAGPASANHPVYVEGNNGSDTGPNMTVVSPGTAGDFDGDGRVGVAEDTDNSTDRIFGTLTTALLGTNGGANANGRVVIVSSGRFGESLTLPNTGAGQAAINGVTIIEAAPGVEAVIDAVISGDPGSAARQAQNGITIDTSQNDRMIILRNLVIRNFTIGLQVSGNARVLVDHCRFDSNVEHNILVSGNARVTMADCTINAAGMRYNPAAATPNPGNGISFMDLSAGTLRNCVISGNMATGVFNGGHGAVNLLGCTLFDNSPDKLGKIRAK